VELAKRVHPTGNERFEMEKTYGTGVRLGLREKNLGEEGGERGRRGRNNSRFPRRGKKSKLRPHRAQYPLKQNLEAGWGL